MDIKNVKESPAMIAFSAEIKATTNVVEALRLAQTAINMITEMLAFTSQRVQDPDAKRTLKKAITTYDKGDDDLRMAIKLESK